MMYAKTWNIPWMSQAWRVGRRRSRMEPAGKRRTKAREARTPCAMRIFWREVEDWEDWEDGPKLFPDWPGLLLLGLPGL